jgi:Tol biopolymer transport system component
MSVPATKLGPYEVKSLLGRGGMGEVYRGWDARLGRNVAIKILPAAFSTDADRLRRFEQEARAAAALNHPNIVAVFDVGTAEGTPYVVSELLEGQTLREAMGSGRLPHRKALDFAIQITAGLAAAHEKGIVHRDIKPENVFVTSDGHVKILDFGLAKLRETQSSERVDTVTVTDGAHSTAGLVIGTAGYMSPEQVRGEAVAHRTDIFSFGATLYEMVSGARAFKGDSAIETLHAILNSDPPDLATGETTKPEIARIVQHCLEKEPAQRFQSARDLAFALKQLTGTASSSAIRRPTLARTRRLPWIAAALLLAALAIWESANYIAGTRAAATVAPSFRQLTFRRGIVGKARFAPDGQTVISSARWDGEPWIVQSTRIDTCVDGAWLGGAELESVSRVGELAVIVRGNTLARVPIGQGGVREVLEGVLCADWAPDGTMAAVRIDGLRNWVEYPLGHPIFEDPNVHSCMRVSPDGQLVAMIEQERGRDAKAWLTIFDRDGHIVSRSQRRPAIPIDHLAWTPDGREVWFSAAANDIGGEGGESAIRAMTTSGVERVVHRTIGSIRIEDISPDWRALVVSDFDRIELRAVDTRTHAERDLTWNGHSVPFGLSSDGHQMIFQDGGAFIGPTDGGPAVKLADGTPIALSPDGKWVLVAEGELTKLSIVPTGAGEGRPLDVKPLDRAASQAEWTPDRQRIVLNGAVGNKQNQFFSIPVNGGAPTPVTPEGMKFFKPIVSPDSLMILAADAKGVVSTYPLDGKGSPVVLVGHVHRDVPLAWSADNTAVWVMDSGQIPAQIFRIDLATGRRTFWYDVPTPDAASTNANSIRLFLSSDGRTFVYSYSKHLSDLYVAEGLK